MKEYLIVLDLDGTLLDDNNKISDFDKLVLKKCKEKGCKIALNTSRNYIRTIPYKEEIDADFTICFNGNYVISDKIIYKNGFTKGNTKKIMDILIERKCNFIVECLNGTYRNRFEKNDVIESNYIRLEDINLKDCYKFLVDCSPDDAINLMSLFTKLDLTLSYDSKNNFLRIMPKESNKWNGLKKLDLEKYDIISFGNDETDLMTLVNSYLGIKMKNSDLSLDSINFWTESNNESGIGKFLNNYFNFDINSNYNNIKILDCTLRDGGHLNKSKFGKNTIYSIINNLIKSNIDIIEIGFLEDCKYDENVACFSNVSEAENLLKEVDCKNSTIALLTQVDKFDISNLEECSGKVKMIRVSFHSNLIEEGMKYCEQVMNKGYICSCNPINFSGYSKHEMTALIKKVNKINPSYFSIVDTFGVMLNNDFSNKIKLLNNLLNDKIKLGLHLHNNLSSSFSTAQILMQQQSRFDNIIIDASLGGMGRAPGNLKTELLAYYLNFEKQNKYDMKYIYKLLEKDIKDISKEYNWDLNFIYSISAFEKVHRTYAEYLINQNCSFFDAQNIIKQIPKENKGRFNETVIKKICTDYFGEV